MSERHKPVPREPLKVWHADYANHLAAAPVRPTRADRLAAANGFANARRRPGAEPVVITPKMLRRVSERDDFRGLLAELEKGNLEAARARFLSHLPELVDLHLWGARRSVEKDDTRGLVHYTVPGLDRVIPKREEQAHLTQQQIVIQLTEKRCAVFDQYAAPIVEAERIEVEPEGDTRLLPESPRKLSKPIGEERRDGVERFF